MKLIADCGSTKIQWCAVEDGKVVKEFFTPGMNAVMLTEEEMTARMANELKPEVEGMIHAIGLILLLILMAFITFNDVKNIFQ